MPSEPTETSALNDTISFLLVIQSIESAKKQAIYNALKKLHEAGLLSGDNTDAYRDAVAGHKNPNSVADALKTLHEAGLLSGESAQRNIDAVLGHERPLVVAHTLKALHKTGLLSRANRDAVARHKKPLDVALALKTLHEAGLLSGEGAQRNIDTVLAHERPLGVAHTLKALHKTGLLSRANREAIVGHEYPLDVASALEVLDEVSLLSGDDAQRKVDIVLGHQNPDVLNDLRSWLIAAEDKQACFNQILQYSSLLYAKHVCQLWWEIPPHQHTLENWQRIIQICRANQVNLRVGVIQLKRYIHHQLLGIPEEEHTAQDLNTRQSTHTASVHQTVSASATRLQEKYGTRITDLNAKLTEVEKWVKAQSDEHAVEKRAIEQLVHAHYDFEDPSSKINTKTLLALVWEAMHDEDALLQILPPLDASSEKDELQALLKSAETLFLQGLYDIQRAYNLSDTFEDDKNEHDKKACASGTFNKLIEKLVGVHPLVQIQHITKQGALFKLEPLIHEVASEHLKTHKVESVTTFKEAIFKPVRERLLFEYAPGKIALLCEQYKTFDALLASKKDYQTFQALLERQQDEGLELMLEGKLLVPDTAPELDEKLQGLLDKQKATEATKTLPPAKLRRKRIRFFEGNTAEEESEHKKLALGTP